MVPPDPGYQSTVVSLPVLGFVCAPFFVTI